MVPQDRKVLGSRSSEHRGLNEVLTKNKELHEDPVPEGHLPN